MFDTNYGQKQNSKRKSITLVICQCQWAVNCFKPPQVHHHPVHWKSRHLKAIWQTTHNNAAWCYEWDGWMLRAPAVLKMVSEEQFFGESQIFNQKSLNSTWLRLALQTWERRAGVETSGSGVGGVGGVGARKCSTWPSFLEACAEKNILKKCCRGGNLEMLSLVFWRPTKAKCKISWISS